MSIRNVLAKIFVPFPTMSVSESPENTSSSTAPLEIKLSPRHGSGMRSVSPYMDTITSSKSGIYVPIPPIHLPFVLLFRIFFKPSSFETISTRSHARRMLTLCAWTNAIMIWWPLLLPPVGYLLDKVHSRLEESALLQVRAMHIFLLVIVTVCIYWSGRWGGYHLDVRRAGVPKNGFDEIEKFVGSWRYAWIHILNFIVGVICTVPVVGGRYKRTMMLSTAVSVHLGLVSGLGESILGRALVGGGLGLDVMLGSFFGLAVGSAGILWSTASLAIAFTVMVAVRYVLDLLEVEDSGQIDLNPNEEDESDVSLSNKAKSALIIAGLTFVGLVALTGRTQHSSWMIPSLFLYGVFLAGLSAGSWWIMSHGLDTHFKCYKCSLLAQFGLLLLALADGFLVWAYLLGGLETIT